MVRDRFSSHNNAARFQHLAKCRRRKLRRILNRQRRCGCRRHPQAACRRCDTRLRSGRPVQSQRRLRPCRRGTRCILDRVIRTGHIGVPCNRRRIARSSSRRHREVRHVVVHRQRGNRRAELHSRSSQAQPLPYGSHGKAVSSPTILPSTTPHAALLQLVRQSFQRHQRRIGPLGFSVVGIVPARHAGISRADQRHVSRTVPCGSGAPDAMTRVSMVVFGPNNASAVGWSSSLAFEAGANSCGIVLFINHAAVERRDRNTPVRLRRIRSSQQRIDRREPAQPGRAGASDGRCRCARHAGQRNRDDQREQKGAAEKRIASLGASVPFHP